VWEKARTAATRRKAVKRGRKKKKKTEKPGGRAGGNHKGQKPRPSARDQEKGR